jgi:hypothetical protein
MTPITPSLAIITGQVAFAGRYRQHTVGALRVMVVQVYVPQRKSRRLLRNQRAHVGFDAVRIAAGGKASSQPVQRSPPAIDFAKQQPTIDRCFAPAVESPPPRDFQTREFPVARRHTPSP